ncbi:hypothetical protein [Skermanella aerolata]|uniref:hypothetical protein n=1 Tax=Skermanella aerolata TaxID=393310 RepID=UPI0012FC670E|nr:hypothetical protein [Skermanella aerolata]
MTAPKPVSNILDAINATISTIDSVGEGRFGDKVSKFNNQKEKFGHRLDTEKGQVSNANPLTDKGFGHFGHFGHLKQEIHGSEAPDEAPDVDRKMDHEATTRGSRARDHPSQVSKVSKVSKPYIEQEVRVGHQTPPGVQPVSKKAGSASGTVNDINPNALKAIREAFLQPKTPAPASDTPEDWRLWLKDRTDHWLEHGLLSIEAGRVAWGEAENVWHRRHGAEPSFDRCAGCDAFMLDGPGMSLLDGAVVHVGQDYGLECLTAYGQKWRGAAYVGLMAMGLEPLGRRS